MVLFNHTIEFPIQRLRCRFARISYDNAFGVRKEVLIRFSNDVKQVRVGGTASSDIDVFPGVIVKYDEEHETIQVLGSDEQNYWCVRCLDESFTELQSVYLVQHMDHSCGNLGSFNHLATAREADFRLNSIRVMGLNADGEEIATVRIDPYIGQVNYDDMDAARI
jgi:hypothetical protein